MTSHEEQNKSNMRCSNLQTTFQRIWNTCLMCADNFLWFQTSYQDFDILDFCRSFCRRRSYCILLIWISLWILSSHAHSAATVIALVLINRGWTTFSTNMFVISPFLTLISAPNSPRACQFLGYVKKRIVGSALHSLLKCRKWPRVQLTPLYKLTNYSLLVLMPKLQAA